MAVIQMLPDGKKPTVQTQFTVQVYPKVEWMHRGRFDAEVAALAKVAR